MELWDNGLVGTAKQIAESDVSPLCVIAGPGTGKSFSLERRVKRLLQTGTKPERIFACTFTRVAANDLKEHLRHTGLKDALNVHAGTIHSFCFKLLSKNDVITNSGRHPRPLLNFEQEFLFHDLKGIGFGNKNKIEELVNGFNASWALSQHQDPGWPDDDLEQQFEEKLIDWLVLHRAILLGELVPLALRFLKENPLSPELFAFDHVLVDEYQDLNKSEQVLVNLLAANGSIAAVGDEDQSIYSFRYAHPDGIVEFSKLENADIKTLNVCRRCPKQIVRMANALISHNKNRQVRKLTEFPNNPEGDVACLQWQNSLEEARGLASIIRFYIKKGVKPGEILVLYNNKKLAAQFADELRRNNIVFQNLAAEDILDISPTNKTEKHKLEALALLGVLGNRQDYVSLRCYLGLGSESLFISQWRDICQLASERGETFYEVLNSIVSQEVTIKASSKIVSRYQELLSRINCLEVMSNIQIIENLFPPSEVWIAPIYRIIEKCDIDTVSITELAEKVRNGLAQIDPPINVDYVRIMTLHKAKGLTTKVTIIGGFLQNIIPFPPKGNMSELQKRKHIEEQRRLFYVAITRPTNTLILSNFIWMESSDAHKVGSHKSGVDNLTRMETSHFIREFGGSAPPVVSGNNYLKSIGISED